MKNPSIRSSVRFARITTPLAAVLSLVLVGCSQGGSSAPEASSGSEAKSTELPGDAYDKVASQGKGFTVGSMISANTVYVMFDPQCPHCGHLWNASIPLQNMVKFVWIPVSLMNAKSGPQGSTLLASSDPISLMTSHEKSLLAGTGGLTASGNASPEMDQAVKNNTELFNSLKIDSVPYILTKNAKGNVVINKGAMDTAGLISLLGISKA